MRREIEQRMKALNDAIERNRREAEAAAEAARRRAEEAARPPAPAAGQAGIPRAEAPSHIRTTLPPPPGNRAASLQGSPVQATPSHIKTSLPPPPASSHGGNVASVQPQPTQTKVGSVPPAPPATAQPSHIKPSLPPPTVRSSKAAAPCNGTITSNGCQPAPAPAPPPPINVTIGGKPTASPQPTVGYNNSSGGNRNVPTPCQDLTGPYGCRPTGGASTSMPVVRRTPAGPQPTRSMRPVPAARMDASYQLADGAGNLPASTPNRGPLVAAAERRLADSGAPYSNKELMCLQPDTGADPKLIDLPLRWHMEDIPEAAIRAGLCPDQPKGDALDACVEQNYGKAVIWAEPDLGGMCRGANMSEDDVAECARRKFVTAWTRQMNDPMTGIVQAPPPSTWESYGEYCFPKGRGGPKRSLRDRLRDSLGAHGDPGADAAPAPSGTASATPPPNASDAPPQPGTPAQTDDAYTNYMNSLNRNSGGQNNGNLGAPLPGWNDSEADAEIKRLNQQVSDAQRRADAIGKCVANGGTLETCAKVVDSDFSAAGPIVPTQGRRGMLARGIVVAGLLFMPGLIAPALGASQQDYADCGQSEDSARSIAACTRVIGDETQSTADRASAYVQRGNDYIASGKLDEAIADYNAAIQLDPKNILANAARAIAYWRKNEQDKAVADYKQAAGLDAASIREMTAPNPELKAIRHAAHEGLCGLAGADWTTTESVATVAAYEDHLARFAVCAYAAIAQQRIAALTQSGSLSIISEVDRGHLGIQITNLTPETAAKIAIKITSGVLVVQVEASSPASRAGLQKDDVVVAVDDDEVDHASDLAAMVGGMKPGTSVKLTLIRPGIEKTISVILGSQRMPPDAAIAYLTRGKALAAKQDFDDAIADYSKALTIDPKYAYALEMRGQAYYGKKDFSHAISDLSDAVDKGFPAYDDLGNAYFATGDFDRAIANYDEAIQRDPHLAYTFYWRGMAKQRKGNQADATADLAKAKELGFNAP